MAGSKWEEIKAIDDGGLTAIHRRGHGREDAEEKWVSFTWD